MRDYVLRHEVVVVRKFLPRMLEGLNNVVKEGKTRYIAMIPYSAMTGGRLS